MTLTLGFQGQIFNLLYLRKNSPDYHETIKKKPYWLNPWPEMWSLIFNLGHDLDLKFSGHVFKQPYIKNGCADCHKMKNEFMDWMLDIKCELD